MKRNPWLVALWALPALGLVGFAAAVVALVEALPDVPDRASNARVDWEWVSVLQMLLLPATALLLCAGTLALLAFYALHWRARSGPRRRRR